MSNNSTIEHKPTGWNTYIVTWNSAIDAQSPEEAALVAIGNMETAVRYGEGATILSVEKADGTDFQRMDIGELNNKPFWDVECTNCGRGMEWDPFDGPRPLYCEDCTKQEEEDI